jgi:copper chaperone CopZ
MRAILVSVAIALALSVGAGDGSVKLSGVHLCCQGCTKRVQAAVGTVPGVTASAEQGIGAITLTAADTAAVQAAVDALVAAGFFGESSDAAIEVNGKTGATGQRVQSIEIEGVHVCCNQCVRVVRSAVGSVTGVTTNTAAERARSFTVSGDFIDKDVFDALHREGLGGRLAK